VINAEPINYFQNANGCLQSKSTIRPPFTQLSDHCQFLLPNISF